MRAAPFLAVERLRLDVEAGDVSEVRPRLEPLIAPRGRLDGHGLPERPQDQLADVFRDEGELFEICFAQLLGRKCERTLPIAGS